MCKVAWSKLLMPGRRSGWPSGIEGLCQTAATLGAAVILWELQPRNAIEARYRELERAVSMEI